MLVLDPEKILNLHNIIYINTLSSNNCLQLRSGGCGAFN